MNSFQKYIFFSLLVLTQTMIQSASLFKNDQGRARKISPYDQADFNQVTDYSSIPVNELFVVIGPNNSHAKLAFFEQKPNGRYQVKFFMLQDPNISAEFSTEQEAQDFLYDFMTQTPIYAAAPSRNPTYDWRKVPQSPRRR